MKSKKKFLEIFKEKLGNISVSCRAYGINRQTFYNWYANDPDFKAAADDVKEVRMDFIENALMQRINAGDTAAIIWATKTICRSRGYVETIESNVSVKTEQPLFGEYDDEETEC